MKVVIEVTANGYSKTVELNDGKKLVEKWERNGNGFSQTDDSVNFEDTHLLDDTVEALGCDFELGDLCDAIENENAEVYDDGDIPTTDDGHILKKGDVFYTVASTVSNKKWTCIPIRLKFPKDWGSHGSSSYISREKCIEECDKRNASE